MCAACVAQGVVYVGGAVAGLQVMAVRARVRRHGEDAGPTGPTGSTGPTVPADDRDGALLPVDHAR
jgi:hypothetical protein